MSFRQSATLGCTADEISMGTWTVTWPPRYGDTTTRVSVIRRVLAANAGRIRVEVY